MKNSLGTIAMGVRAPIIREGDNIAEIVTRCILQASKDNNIPINDGDVIAITESVVARAEGNYVTVDDIAQDVESKYGKDAKISVIFPILSRNRFAMCLKGIARAVKHIDLVLLFPADEVGNELINKDELLDSEKMRNFEGLVLNENDFRKFFGYPVHPFTGIDYVAYYRSIIEAENCSVNIFFTDSIEKVIYITQNREMPNVLLCDIHTRAITKKMFTDKKKAGIYLYAFSDNVYNLSDICSQPVREGSGYNPEYGLLGSNKADEERIKLFPRTGRDVVSKVRQLILRETGKLVEVMIYGDGAFKDPVGKIWELADPVVSPAYTSGLLGRPNELKLKALADGKFANLQGKELQEAIEMEIKTKGDCLVADMSSQGTTPRQYTDLLGSLSDLVSGSGDKGTPIVWIKGYFKNYAND